MRLIAIILLCVSTTVCGQSTNLIGIDPGLFGNIYNTTGKKNPDRLFDNNLATNMDPDGFAGNAFASPMQWYIVLDSTYNDMKIDYYVTSGMTDWVVKVYGEDSVANRRTFAMSGAFPAQWKTITQLDTVSFPIRFIYFRTTEPSSNVMELKIYGDAAAIGTNILPTPASATPDPGIKFQGVGSLDDKDTVYMRYTAGSWRITGVAFAYSHTPGAAWGAMPIVANYYGDLKARKLTFFKNRNIESILYIAGSSITRCQTCLVGDTYNKKADSTNWKKDIAPGSDSTLVASWATNHARMWKALAHLYSNNPESTLAPDYSVSGTTLTAGQDVLMYYEIGNEDNKTWGVGANAMTAYHSPMVMLAKLRAAYDSIKSVNVNAKVILGALPWMDMQWWKGMWFLNYWNYGSKNFPADGIAFNQYLHSGGFGQPKEGVTNGVTPGQFKVRERLDSLDQFGDIYLPGREKRWHEFGYTPDADSHYDVSAYGPWSAEEVKANWGVDVLEMAALTRIDRVVWYWQLPDGAGVDFDGMAMVDENFDGGGAYTGSTPRPVYYWYATRKILHDNFNARATAISYGDSTGMNVTYKTHLTDNDSLLVYLRMATRSNSTTTDYEIPINNVLSATLVTMANGDMDGVRTTLTPVNGRVTVSSITEAPSYVLMVVGDAPIFRMKGRYRFRTN